MEQLGDGLSDLHGDPLLDALVAAGEWGVLHAMWNVEEGELAQRLVPRLAHGPAGMVDLLVGEVEAPRFGDVISPSAVMSSLLQADARCSSDAAGRLLDLTNLDPEEQPAEIAMICPDLVRWLLEQDHPEADRRAIEICALTSPDANNDSIRHAACHRLARGEPLLRQQVIVKLNSRSTWDEVTWARTAQFASISLAEHLEEPGVKELAGTLVRNSVAQTELNTIEESAARFLLTSAETILEVFGGEAFGAEAGAGPIALLTTIPQHSDQQWQLRVAETVMQHQPALWDTHFQVLADSWEERSWQLLLYEWPERHERAAIGQLDALVDRAPPDVDVVALIAFVTQLEHDTGGPAANRAAQRLRGRIAIEDEAEAEPDGVPQTSVMDTIRWPTPDDDAVLSRFEWILTEALGPEQARAAIAHAYTQNQLNAPLVAQLVPAEAPWAEFVQLAPLGDLRVELVDALVKEHGEPALEPLAARLETERDLDIADGLARHDVAAAFAHAGGWWDELDEAERDRLVKLLDRDATVDQLHLVDQVVADTSATNRDRRTTAAAVWGRLAPKRESVTPGITSLLDSATPALVEAGIAAIGAALPRDKRTLRDLRDKAAAPGIAGEAARRALDEIELDVAAELEGLSPGPPMRAAGPGLCQLLGIVAGPRSFDLLCAHVGPNAPDEDLPLRRAAAAALQECCEARSTEPDELERLGGLLHGELGVSQETDIEARQSLERAYRRAELRDEAALALLDDQLGAEHLLGEFVPAGQEKARLLDALQRMANRRHLGAAGYGSYIQTLDLVLERVARACYLLVGTSENLKQLIRDDQTEPKYGNVIDALGSTVASAAKGPLLVVHNMRSQKTDAHLDDAVSDADVQQAEEEFGNALGIIYHVMVDADPLKLRAVEDVNDASA